DVLKGYREAGWQFTDQEHLRAFLARVTYNHFANHCRRNRPALEHEQPLAEDDSAAQPECDQPRPSQVAQADELWSTMIAACLPGYRLVLKLKGQGVPLAEIADRTGLHESSVRRVLYELARRLAAARGRSAAR